LKAARGHYSNALRADPNNLRARLGYAYVLDRLGRTNDARRELRTIIKKRPAAPRGTAIGLGRSRGAHRNGGASESSRDITR
jgi:predicted Zn-dependent protease